jgi:hypothetical protein
VIGGGEELQVLGYRQIVVDAEAVGHVAEDATDLAGV